VTAVVEELRVLREFMERTPRLEGPRKASQRK
jgi:hypothetical protein